MSVSPGNGWLPARPEIEHGRLSRGKLAGSNRSEADVNSTSRRSSESILVISSPDLVILFGIFLNTWYHHVKILISCLSLMRYKRFLQNFEFIFSFSLFLFFFYICCYKLKI